MNDKLQSLVEEFPNAFNGDFYFECQDGWYDIIRPVIIVISKNNSNNPEDKIYPSQVKEKFGTLRFYTDYVNDSIDEIVSKAEKQSHTTCEECGEAGELIASSWLYTACSTHTKAGQRTYAEFIRLRDEAEKEIK